MELVDYMRVLRRRILLILLIVVIAAGAAVAYSLTQTKEYEASARFSITVPTAGGAPSQLNAIAAGTAQQFASTGPAITAAVARAGYTGGADVTASNAENSAFVTVTVRDPSARRAAAVANAYQATLPEVVRARTNGGTTIELLPLELASPPSKATTPRPVRNGEIGLLLGIVLGVGVAFLREALDRSFASPERLEDASGIEVLGVVPQELAGVDLPSVTHIDSIRAEAYRTVRTNIQFAGPEHSLKTIVITSATPGEGKTTVASNLAVAFARTGQSVVIVDADMRRPRIAKAFGLKGSAGLSTVLNQQATLDEALQTSEPGLWVLTSGEIPDNPSELLGSTRMVTLLEELGERFDVVLLDTPPVLPVTDPLVLAVQATGVVLVVRLGTTSRDRLKRALGSLSKLDVPLLGIVANGSVASADPAYAYGYKYGYGYTDRGRRRRAKRRDAEARRAVPKDDPDRAEVLPTS